MGALSASAERRFEDQLLAHFQGSDSSGQKTSAWDRESVQSLIKKAQTYGMKSERDMFGYAQLANTLGQDFDTDPKHAWCVPILMDSELVPESKLKALRETRQAPAADTAATAQTGGFGSQPPGEVIEPCPLREWKLEVTVVSETAEWPANPIRIRIDGDSDSRAETVSMTAKVSPPCAFTGWKPASFRISAALLGWELVASAVVQVKAPAVERVTLHIRPLVEAHWISIELVGEDGAPIPNQPYQIRLDNGLLVGGTLDDKGRARVDGIPTGQPCQLTFPNLDQGAWELCKPTSASK